MASIPPLSPHAHASLSHFTAGLYNLLSIQFPVRAPTYVTDVRIFLYLYYEYLPTAFQTY